MALKKAPFFPHQDVPFSRHQKGPFSPHQNDPSSPGVYLYLIVSLYLMTAALVATASRAPRDAVAGVLYAVCESTDLSDVWRSVGEF